MKLDRIQRLLRLIHTLQSGRPYSVEDLAEVLDINRRTVFRDLKLLTGTGIKFSYDRPTRRYHADRENALPPVSLTYAEALPLLLTTRHILKSPIMADRSTAVSAALKIESLLPRAMQDYCGTLLEHVEVRHSPSSDAGAVTDIFALLQNSLAAHRKVRVRYDSYYEGKPIDEVLHPYRLAHIHSGWYLIAFAQNAGKCLTFKLERIMEIKVLDETCEIDAEFNLDDYFGSAWMMIKGEQRYHVKIKFLPMVAGNVDEITWHKTQRTAFQEDGSLLFEVDVDGIEEISWWVLGYGDQAEVLEPQELRSLIGQRAARMTTLYNSTETTSPKKE